MNVNEILDEWEKDNTIDPLNLGGAALDISRLYSKYLRRHTEATLALKVLERQMRKLRFEKFEYYKHGSDPDTLKLRNWPPNQKSYNTKEYLEMAIDADEEVEELRMHLDHQKEKVEVLRRICDVVSRRSFHIQIALEDARFKQGLSSRRENF